MSKNTVVQLRNPGADEDLLSTMLREGAQRLVAHAVKAELEQYLCAFAPDEDRRLPVVRNGFQPERQILTGVGPVNVCIPKVRSRTETSAVFHSQLVPPYVRRAKSLDTALPWLYLHGVSTGDMKEALSALLGKDAAGLSAPVVARLKRRWTEEYKLWSRSSLRKERWVYLWADGIYSGLRAEDARLCALVVIGVNERGQKRFLAIEDGVRESTQSWQELLLGLKARGLSLPPKLAVGDGALGFWAALGKIFPQTTQQRCWVHKTVNVLNYLPRTLQPKAKAALHDIWMASTKTDANKAFDQFLTVYSAKYPKATECLAKDRAAMLAFYEFPAEHWIHIRSTNVIESAFATIRHRTDRTKGCLTRDGMLAMIFKLSLGAQKSWQRLRGFDHLAKLIKGSTFRDGIEVTSTARNQPHARQNRIAA